VDELAHYSKRIISFERSAKEIKEKNNSYQSQILKLKE